MRILVVSDNHGERDVLEDILKRETFDVSIHLGDSEFSEQYMKKNFTYFVQGNHDLYLPMELFVEIDGIKFALCHGHTIGLSMWNRELPAVNLAKTSGVTVVLHGHTHVFEDKKVNGIRIICPGAVYMSRGPEGNGYIIITTDKGKIKSVEFKSA